MFMFTGKRRLTLLLALLAISTTVAMLSTRVEIRAADTFSWWPMALNNWWEYRQTDIGASPIADDRDASCDSRSDWGRDRTTWWVMPPDLTFRGDGSKTLTMFKTHRCLYNYRGHLFNIRWSMRHQGDLGIVEGPNPLSVKWQTQTGIIRFEVSGLYDPTSVSQRLPFTKSDVNAYYRDEQLRMSKGGVRRQPATATNVAYALFPPSVAALSTLAFTVNAPDYYTFGPAQDTNPVQEPWIEEEWKELYSYTYTYSNSGQQTDPKWYTRFRFVRADMALGWSSLPSTIQSRVTPQALLLEATYAEELTSNNHYCERWYYAKDIGPVIINYTRMTTTISISTCLDYFNSGSPTNYSRIYLNDYSVAGGLGYDDTPDAVANTEWSSEGELFYVEDGFWWTYKMGNGRLYTHGRLQDVWGDKICPGCTGPFPYDSGTKVAAVWSPSYAQHVSGDSSARFVIFIDGKYWVWRQTAGNNKWFNTGLSGTLLANAPLCYGKSVHQNNGPEAASQTSDGQGIHFYNEGCVWRYAPINGTWIWIQNAWTPNLVRNTFSQMPAVDGYRPQNPEAAVQFVGAEYLEPGTYTYPSNWQPTQHLLFELGRIWMTDNANHFENWGGIWE